MCAYSLSVTEECLAPVRKIHSLRQTDIDVAAVELRRMFKDWSLDQHDECDGDVLLILTPPEPDPSAVTFILTRTATGIQLAVTEDDWYEVVGRFPSVTAAIRHMVSMVARPGQCPALELAN